MVLGHYIIRSYASKKYAFTTVGFQGIAYLRCAKGMVVKTWPSKVPADSTSNGLGQSSPYLKITANGAYGIITRSAHMSQLVQTLKI